ncbi:pilus assembly protein [Devosia sp. YIM 151766]|uniref:TadE family protein n=1 Tax=Devosia sp. YIM 151766 TaxID=3017325 RepID=UPI00255C5967|nr:TadE family protein [Devosia sp. YIM 151766]WIY52905.1 pilus assembly protein [Devosia sp. YIM 151766]
MVLRPHHWADDDHGAAIIEFAILTPVFLLMLMGMLAYGIYFGAAHAIQQLAADAARTAIAGVDAPEGQRLARDYLRRNGGVYMLIDPLLLDYDVAVAEDNRDQYLVRVSYDASDLPIWNLYPPLPLPSPHIVHWATIRRGGL